MNYPNEVVVGNTKYVPGMKWINNFNVSVGHMHLDDLSKLVYLSMIKQKKLLTKNFLLENKTNNRVETMVLSMEQKEDLYKGYAQMDVSIMLPNYCRFFSVACNKSKSVTAYLKENNMDLVTMVKSMMKGVLGEDDFFDIEFIHDQPAQNNQTLYIRVRFNLKYGLSSPNLVVYFVFLSLFTYTLGQKMGYEEAFNEVVENAKVDPYLIQLGQYADGREYAFQSNLNKTEGWNRIKEALSLTKPNKDAIATSYACHKIAKTLTLSEVK